MRWRRILYVHGHSHQRHECERRRLDVGDGVRNVGNRRVQKRQAHGVAHVAVSLGSVHRIVERLRKHGLPLRRAGLDGVLRRKGVLQGEHMEQGRCMLRHRRVWLLGQHWRRARLRRRGVEIYFLLLGC